MSTIKELVKEERPIERFLKEGSHISNEELLAILINHGTKNKSSKELAREILSEIKEITNLKNITLEKLTKINGIGMKKAATILAAIELGKRINQENTIMYHQKITEPSILAKYYQDVFQDCYQEHFYCVYLDNKKRILKEKLLFIGTINYSFVHPREIFKEAYLLSASAIICVHNHPSLDATPSKEDKILTKNLKQIGELLGIPIIDHIIIGDGYYSFCESGEL